MSKNFELLRRAGIADVLFIDRLLIGWPDAGERVSADNETAREIAKAEKDGAPRHGLGFEPMTRPLNLCRRVFVFLTPTPHACRLLECR